MNKHDQKHHLFDGGYYRYNLFHYATWNFETVRERFKIDRTDLVKPPGVSLLPFTNTASY